MAISQRREEFRDGLGGDISAGRLVHPEMISAGRIVHPQYIQSWGGKVSARTGRMGVDWDEAYHFGSRMGRRS